MEVSKNGVLFLRFLYEGSHYFGSISSAPDFGNFGNRKAAIHYAEVLDVLPYCQRPLQEGSSQVISLLTVLTIQLVDNHLQN